MGSAHAACAAGDQYYLAVDSSHDRLPYARREPERRCYRLGMASGTDYSRVSFFTESDHALHIEFTAAS